MIEDQLKSFVTHIVWSLEEEVYDDTATTTWVSVIDNVDLGYVDSHRHSNVFLRDGGHYRSVVKLCHTVVCFGSQTSNGFWVIANPTLPGEVEVVSLEVVGESTHLTVQLQQFENTYIVNDPLRQDLIHYQWAVVELLSKDRRHTTQWHGIPEENFVTTDDMV